MNGVVLVDNNWHQNHTFKKASKSIELLGIFIKDQDTLIPADSFKTGYIVSLECPEQGVKLCLATV